MLFLLVLFLVQYGECVDKSEFRCSEDFCNEVITAVRCPVFDVTECANETLALTIPTPMVCSCCETCLTYQKEGDDCILGTIGQPIPTQMCGPGLLCEGKKCVKMSPTVYDPLNHETAYKCDDNTCTCLSKERVEIYGSFPKSETKDGSQFCGCSALAHEVQKMAIRALPFEGTYQPFARCLPNGKFDPLQCYEGFCMCIDSETGAYDETIQPISIWSLAPGTPICFNETVYNHTRDYYRPCEKYLLLLQRARDYAEADGYIFLFPYTVECRPDGNFSKEPTEEEVEAFIKLERMIQLSGHTGFI